MRALEEAVKERRRPATTSASSGEVTPMAVTAEMVTVTLPKHERRSWEVEKVEEDTVELW